MGRTADKPRYRNTDEISPDEQRSNVDVEKGQHVPPSTKADIESNQSVPSREHPEGSAPPLDRLTEDEADDNWSELT